MASNKMLSIDITNDSITIVEVTSNGKTRTVHNAMICETPDAPPVTIFCTSEPLRISYHPME